MCGQTRFQRKVDCLGSLSVKVAIYKNNMSLDRTRLLRTGYILKQILILWKWFHLRKLCICFRTKRSCSFNPSKRKLKRERERERERKNSIRVEAKRKYVGESEKRFIIGGHLVRRYPGNARSSF
jgi:hypothetical protein